MAESTMLVSGRRARRRPVAGPVLVGAAATLALAVWFGAGWGGTGVIRYVDDFATGLAALYATRATWRAAREGAPAYRRSWAIITAGTLAWVAAETAWTIVDLTGGMSAGNIFLVSAGFLPLPLLACAALLRLPTDDGRAAGRRWLLDGGIVALSTGFVVWNSLAQQVGDVRLGSPQQLMITAFPLVDVTLLTMVVLAASYASLGHRRLWVLAAALGLLTIADSSFAYLSATRQYAPGAYCDVAYVAAFVTLAAAAGLPSGARSANVAGRTLAPLFRFTLPYIPLVVAAGFGIDRLATGHTLGVGGVTLWTALTGLVLVRQYFALLDNRRLVEDLEQERERLRSFALTDPLTGVGNRVMFADRVQHAVALHHRDQRPVTVCWLDVDDFKVINDTYGHAVGDQLLVDLTRRFAGVLRAGDTLARLGGDEFGILLEDGADPAAVARRLHAASDLPLPVAGHRIRVPISIGVATLAPGDDPVTSEELMSRADIAMYAAKAMHAERIQAFRPGMTVPGAEDAALRDPLKDAVHSGTIEVHYQPVVVADTGRLRGFEALARWTLDGRPVPPSQFVALAERLGLARELGDHVLRTALAQLAAWSRVRGDAGLVMSVNLSADQLFDPTLPQRVEELLRAEGLHPGQITLEITEGALLTDSPNALITARALDALGIGLALDDFGTGYSSLAHLRGFPLKALKIDRSFIADVDNDAQARHFLRAIARFGRDLGLRLVAEGVERASQLEVVRHIGLDYVQGFLFSRPEPAHRLDALVRQPVPSLEPLPAPSPVRRTDKPVAERSRPAPTPNADFIPGT